MMINLNPHVRITHMPTGLCASANQYKSERQNYEAAMKVLKGKLWTWNETHMNEDDLMVELKEALKMVIKANNENIDDGFLDRDEAVIIFAALKHYQEYVK